MPPSPYKWINDAPIYEKTPDAMLGLVKAMCTALAGWDSSFDFFDADAEGASAEMNEAAEKVQEGWNDRVRNAGSLLNMIETKCTGLKSSGADRHLCVAYLLTGIPVGLMVLLKPDYICDITSHPGVADAGSTLIEYAVNYSADHGGDGKLELFSYSDQSSGFYRHVCGFVPESEGSSTMALDPARSPMWENVGGGWSLKRFAGKQYLGPGNKPLPPLPPRGMST